MYPNYIASRLGFILNHILIYVRLAALLLTLLLVGKSFEHP